MGTLTSFGEGLKRKIQAMHPKERVVGLNIDGAKIKAKREFDIGDGSFIGHPTINPPKETMEKREKNGETTSIDSPPKLFASWFVVSPQGGNKSLGGTCVTAHLTPKKFMIGWSNLLNGCKN